jgi:glycosyltransferase involved in cell wall biosynthesis
VKVALFADSFVYQDPAGNYFPLTDQFIRFIEKLSRHVGVLTVATRCTREEPAVKGLDPLLPNEQFRYQPLPFYRTREDFYKRLPLLAVPMWRILRSTVQECDVVLVRLRHSLAPFLYRLAGSERKPLALYWGGPPVVENTSLNYPGPSLKHRTARLLARMELRLNRRMAGEAAWNFFIDPHEHRLMGSPARTQFVVPTMVTTGQIVAAPGRRRAGPMRIVFAGKIYRPKGVFDLLEGIRLLRSQGEDVHLFYAGEGPDTGALRAEVLKAGLSECVTLLGNLLYQDLQATLRNGHVFALPSYAEGLPKVLWEAWAAGLAVVMSNVGSIGDHVVNGRTGLLVNPGEVNGLAHALGRLSRDEDLRWKLAQGGWEAARLHTWDQEIENIAHGLRRILTRPTAQAPTDRHP